MNIVLGLIVLVACVGVGYACANKYVVRKEFFNDFFEFNKTLKNEISFSMKKLDEIICKNDNKRSFYKCLIEYLNTKELELGQAYLTIAEKEFLVNYFDSIGKSDRETQINFLNGVTVEIKDRLDVASADEKKYKTLYLKMGFLIGLLIFIILL